MSRAEFIWVWWEEVTLDSEGGNAAVPRQPAISCVGGPEPRYKLSLIIDNWRTKYAADEMQLKCYCPGFVCIFTLLWLLVSWLFIFFFFSPKVVILPPEQSSMILRDKLEECAIVRDFFIARHRNTIWPNLILNRIFQKDPGDFPELMETWEARGETGLTQAMQSIESKQRGFSRDSDKKECTHTSEFCH